jgi:hypothetical protein
VARLTEDFRCGYLKAVCYGRYFDPTNVESKIQVFGDVMYCLKQGCGSSDSDADFSIFKISDSDSAIFKTPTPS